MCVVTNSSILIQRYAGLMRVQEKKSLDLWLAVIVEMKWGKAHSIRGEPELRYISRALFLDFLLCTLRFFINHVCRSNIHENNFTPTYHLEETSIKKKDASSTLQFKCKHPDEF
jgi:hypothetical protein